MVIMSMRPAQPQAVITKVSISALVISLPILYASLLRLPPYTLARDTTFWFLMSNSIIAIIAADSGMLFFTSGSDDDDDNDLSNYVVSSDQPAAAVQEDCIGDASALSSDEPTTVDISDVLGGDEQLPTSSCTVTSTGMERHGLALIRGEHASSSNMDHAQAQVLQRWEEEEAAAAVVLEPSTNKNSALVPKVEEEEEEEVVLLRTPPLATSGDGGDELAIIVDYHDELFETTEPPTSDPRITRDDDVPQDNIGTVAAREEKKPRCSATAAAEDQEREYWQLSDEELNRKVEEFITRFNRDMIEQEAGVVSEGVV